MAHSQDLADYQWKNRLIVTVATDTGQAAVAKQLSLLADHTAGLHDRKLKVLSFAPSSAPALLKDKSTAAFQVFLIGLDGGVKFSSPQPTEAKTFFELIDQMPMRQRELRQRP